MDLPHRLPSTMVSYTIKEYFVGVCVVLSHVFPSAHIHEGLGFPGASLIFPPSALHVPGVRMYASSPQVDFVDINLGCPIDLVCDKGMGAALMGRTRKLRGIIAVSVCSSSF